MSECSLKYLLFLDKNQDLLKNLRIFNTPNFPGFKGGSPADIMEIFRMDEMGPPAKVPKCDIHVRFHKS